MARHEKLWRILTMHCDEASRLSSESLDHPLNQADRLACRIHLLICGACRNHRRDILTLREVSRQASVAVEPPGTSLTTDARERIKQALKDADPTG